jgi:hypothetical protein
MVQTYAAAPSMTRFRLFAAITFTPTLGEIHTARNTRFALTLVEPNSCR